MSVNERIFPVPLVISQLNDWEILSAFTYCNKVIKKETFLMEEEFYDLCFFFFDGDEDATTLILQKVKKLYLDEYSKRHCN
jgi:hypothetical protein